MLFNLFVIKFISHLLVKLNFSQNIALDKSLKQT